MSLVRFRDWPPPFIDIVIPNLIWNLLSYGQLAQSVEQVTENHCVLGSIPRLATTLLKQLHGQLAQSVDQVTENHCVLGSIPRLATTYFKN